MWNSVSWKALLRHRKVSVRVAFRPEFSLTNARVALKTTRIIYTETSLNFLESVNLGDSRKVTIECLAGRYNFEQRTN